MAVDIDQGTVGMLAMQFNQQGCELTQQGEADGDIAVAGIFTRGLDLGVGKAAGVEGDWRVSHSEHPACQ